MPWTVRVKNSLRSKNTYHNIFRYFNPIPIKSMFNFQENPLIFKSNLKGTTTTELYLGPQEQRVACGKKIPQYFQIFQSYPNQKYVQFSGKYPYFQIKSKRDWHIDIASSKLLSTLAFNNQKCKITLSTNWQNKNYFLPIKV